jgi:hypothetical protein
MTGAMLAGGLTVGPVAHGSVPPAAASSPQATRQERSLGSVSCVGAAFCMGVGPYGDQLGSGRPFSQIWNGKSWRTAPVPSSKRGLGLLGVSCIPTKHCIAVGGLDFNRGTQLSEAWNGSSWRQLRGPAVTGHSELTGVACLAANRCLAVGTSGKRGVTALAQVWNGKSWVLKPPVVPPGSVGSTLSAVACSAVSNCLAVGEYTTTEHVEVSLAESWDGHSWTMLPSPSGITELHGVACPTVKLCVGVGAGTNGVDGEFSIASAVWNGTSWTALDTPSPVQGNVLQTLSSVSCTSAKNCIASGSGPGPYNDGIGTGPFAEKWTGGTGGTLLSVPDPRAIGFSPAGDRNSAAGLSSVSCTSGSRCIAVGGAGQSDALLAFSPFAAAWNGQRWTILRTSKVDGFFGASCASSSKCLMTGTYLDRGDVAQTLVESFDGAHVRVASPRGLSGVLSDISCPTASFCLAGRGKSAASWNGKRWTWTGAVAKTVLVHNAEGTINELSCASAKFCVAITGDSRDSFGEFWDGTSWRNAPLVVPKGSHVLMDITGLSCAKNSTRCLAVGTWEADFGNGKGGTLAELWNGHAWQILSAPGQLDLTETFSAVSCLTGTNCTALGVKLNTGPADRLLALSWNGHSWKITQLPGKFPDTLGITSLSCPAAASCVGLGSYVVPPIRPPLKIADISPVWNGHTWRIVRPGGPAGLATVSCASARECVAIGQPGTATLARLWNGRAWKAINTINP